MSLSCELIGQAYNQVLTQLVQGYEFVMKDGGLDICLRMKALVQCLCRLTCWMYTKSGLEFIKSINVRDSAKMAADDEYVEKIFGGK